MNTKSSPQELLQQIAAIQHMEPGKLCIIREGPDGPYRNLQCRENGKPITRYVSQDQADMVATHTANYQKFRGLVAQYAQQVIENTRAERIAGVKKKTKKRPFSLPRAKKSNS